MLRGLFPRLFSQYREGGLICGKWNIGASGAVTPQTGEVHPSLTLTKEVAAGTYTVAVTGGVGKLQILDLRYVGKTAPTTVADLRTANVNTAIVPGSTGFGFVLGDGVANTIEEGTSGDEIHIALLVNK